MAQGAKKGQRSRAEARQERLAAALRANLKKRKAQLQGRTSGPAGNTGAKTVDAK